jgi:hypothetical protein
LQKAACHKVATYSCLATTSTDPPSS